jgi:hypothetical protein
MIWRQIMPRMIVMPRLRAGRIAARFETTDCHMQVYCWHCLTFDAIKIGRGHDPAGRMAEYAMRYRMKPDHDTLRFVVVPGAKIAETIEGWMIWYLSDKGYPRLPIRGNHDKWAREVIRVGSCHYQSVADDVCDFVELKLCELYGLDFRFSNRPPIIEYDYDPEDTIVERRTPRPWREVLKWPILGNDELTFDNIVRAYDWRMMQDEKAVALDGIFRRARDQALQELKHTRQREKA